jgi:hypothetical protein
MFIFSALLYYVLTPGIFITIPSKSSKKIVALVHGLVYSIFWYFTYNIVFNVTVGFKTYTEEQTKRITKGENAYKAYQDYLDYISQNQ